MKPEIPYAIMVRPDERAWVWEIVDRDGLTVMAGRDRSQTRAIRAAWEVGSAFAERLGLGPRRPCLGL